MTMGEKKKIGVITQVRMSSTRLPKKIMKLILGKPMLVLFLERLKRMGSVDEIIVATTTEKEDDIIVKTIKDYDDKIKVYRGSMDDVLDRYYKAAKTFGVDIVVRITSDCPLIDPKVSDTVIENFISEDCDYCCNNISPRTYPHGLDTEVFSFKSLERAWKEAKEGTEREHVTPYIRGNPKKFQITEVKYRKIMGYLRWTVDYPEDFEFVKAIFERLYPTNRNFGMEDILQLLQKEPELNEINKKYAV